MAIRKSASKAASLLGKRSVESRKEKLGEKEFNRHMQEIGKLGGRPKGSVKSKATKKGAK